MKNFKDKVAVVTGAAQGIGRETAIALAKEGCHLAICDVDTEGLGGTAEIIRGLGRRVFTQKVDMADRKAVYDFAKAVIEEFKGVQILVNNAGVALTSSIREMDYEDFEWLMNINFWGMVYGTKAFLPTLEAQGEANIVNISSVFGLMAIPTQSAYNCSKFAIRGFTEALSMELSNTNVHVTSVHPGGIRTNIARNSRFKCEDGLATSKEDAVRLFDKVAKTSAGETARIIVQGIRKNKKRVLVGNDARVMDALQRLLPVRYQKVVLSMQPKPRKKV